MNRTSCIIGLLSLGLAACSTESAPLDAQGSLAADGAATASAPKNAAPDKKKAATGKIKSAKDQKKPAKPEKKPANSSKTAEKTQSGPTPAAKSAPAGTAGAADKAKGVHAIAFDAQKFPAARPPGEVLGGFAFHDSAGDNYVIFAREDRGNEDHIHTSVLRIKHVVKSGSGMREVRSYTERVEDCDLDIFLEPKFGDWSVSDVDQNGIGEASFAYTVACVGDVSPLPHKAFVTEGGQKYVLRGIQQVRLPDSKPEGGTYKADPMPAVFMEKARDVWARTSRGYWAD